MKVSSSDSTISANQERLETLNKNLKNTVSQREKEIENVKNRYDRMLVDQDRIGEEAYQNKIEQNNQKLISAGHDVEQKLKVLNENIEKTKQQLNKEESALKENNVNEINNLKEQFSNLYDNINTNGMENQSNIQYKTNNQLKVLADNSHNEINQMQNKSHSEISALSMDFNNKQLLNEKDFRNRINQDMALHQEDVIRQKDQFKKDVDMTTEKNKRLELEKNRVQTDELTYMDKYHKDLMEQKDKDFKIRYDNQVKEHERILTDIKTKLENDIHKTQLQTQETMRSIATKAEDPFYRIEKLNPELKELPKSYQISIEIPPHEKEDLHLIARGRELKLTFNKKYNDTVMDIDGSTNRTTKTQLFSREFKTHELLNSKNITEKYENGILTFNVEKL